jgi:hypothetical protein
MSELFGLLGNDGCEHECDRHGVTGSVGVNELHAEGT